MRSNQAIDPELCLSEKDQERIRLHLQKLLESRAFAYSKRSQSFLRYIVEETLAGRSAQIKERNIGVDVFGRDESFDPQQESVVRVGAGEVRKRLLQAYYMNFGDGVQIELPIGSYCPKIKVDDAVHLVPGDSPVTPASSPMQPSRTLYDSPDLETSSGFHPSFDWVKRGSRILYAATFLLCAGVASILITHKLEQKQPLDQLWQEFAERKQPVLIAMPTPRAVNVDSTNSLDISHSAKEVSANNLNLLEGTYTGTGAGWGAARFAEQLAFRHQPFIIRFGNEASFPDIEQSPTILLGGRTSLLGIQLTRNLRFRLVHDDNKAAIVDTFGKGKEWSIPWDQPPAERKEGYTLISILHNSDSGYPVMVIAGLHAVDTQAGAAFLTNNQYFEAFAQQAPKDWQKKNCQIVLHNPVYGNSPGKPTIAAWYVW